MVFDFDVGLRIDADKTTQLCTIAKLGPFIFPTSPTYMLWRIAILGEKIKNEPLYRI